MKSIRIFVTSFLLLCVSACGSSTNEVARLDTLGWKSTAILQGAREVCEFNYKGDNVCSKKWKRIDSATSEGSYPNPPQEAAGLSPRTEEQRMEHTTQFSGKFELSNGPEQYAYFSDDNNKRYIAIAEQVPDGQDVFSCTFSIKLRGNQVGGTPELIECKN